MTTTRTRRLALTATRRRTSRQAAPVRDPRSRAGAARRTVGRGLIVTLLNTTAVALSAGVASAASSPILSWTPSTGSTATSFAYATIDSGTTAVQTFTLRNSGGSATSALNVALTGSSAFGIIGDTCSGTSLGPKKSCTVTVQYAPTTAGQTDTATLTAISNKPAARTTHNLSGASTTAFVENPVYRGRFQGTFGSDCNYGVDVSGLLPSTTYVFRSVRIGSYTRDQTYTTFSDGSYSMAFVESRGTYFYVQAYRDGVAIGDPSATYYVDC